MTFEGKLIPLPPSDVATPPMKSSQVNNSVPPDKCVHFRRFPAVWSDSGAMLLRIVAVGLI